MRDEWTTDVDDIPEHILKKHIEVQDPSSRNKKYSAYEVDFYRKHGYPTRRIKPTKYKSGANLITGHVEAGLNSHTVGSGKINTATIDRALNGVKF